MSIQPCVDNELQTSHSTARENQLTLRALLVLVPATVQTDTHDHLSTARKDDWRLMHRNTYVCIAKRGNRMTALNGVYISTYKKSWDVM